MPTTPTEDLPSLRSMPITGVLAIHSTGPTPSHLTTYRVRLPPYGQPPDSMWLFMRIADAQEVMVQMSFAEYKKMVQAGQALLAAVD